MGDFHLRSSVNLRLKAFVLKRKPFFHKTTYILSKKGYSNDQYSLLLFPTKLHGIRFLLQGSERGFFYTSELLQKPHQTSHRGCSSSLDKIKRKNRSTLYFVMTLNFEGLSQIYFFKKWKSILQNIHYAGRHAHISFLPQ